jgi:hypothetical protein
MIATNLGSCIHHVGLGFPVQPAGSAVFAPALIAPLLRLPAARPERTLSSLKQALSKPGPRRGEACSGPMDFGYPIRPRGCCQLVSLNRRTLFWCRPPKTPENLGRGYKLVYTKPLVDSIRGEWDRGLVGESQHLLIPLSRSMRVEAFEALPFPAFASKFVSFLQSIAVDIEHSRSRPPLGEESSL